MRKLAVLVLAAAALGALFAAIASRGGSPSAAQASSHREAPLISEDPSADNTDTYAFRSPDRPDTVSIISNYIPGEDPAAGPNWYTFSPSARYVVYADKNGDGKPDVTWRFRFKSQAPVAFLQNTQQSYTVTRVEGNSSRVVGEGLLTPPDNIGPRSTPDYHSLAMAGVRELNDGSKVFAGQRDDGFFGDIGAAFDLVAIRSGTGATGGGKDFFAGYAVHSISLQVPLSQLYPQFGPFQETNRTDLVSVLLTGLKEPNLNFTGDTRVDEIRLNLAIAPTAPVGHGNRLGVLGGDLAGWPNGRRLEDDVIDIAERAVGGALIGHSLPLGDGVDANDVPYLTSFPYQAAPSSAYDNTKGEQKP